MKIHWFTVPLVALLALPAAGQNLAPGLWEVSMKMPGGPDLGAAMAKMNEQLANMSPEQRKQIEAMLGQQGVAPKAQAPGQPGALRICISKEMAARGEVPDPDGRCKQDSLEKRGNKVNFKFTCSGEPPSSGEGEYIMNGDKGYDGRMVTNTVRAGKPVRMEMQMAGRFISADCGQVKARGADGKPVK